MNRSISTGLTEQVRRQIEENLPRGLKSKLLAGVSGGPDSMSLLYLLQRLGMEVIVVHCNYRLRGRESDMDQRLVEETAAMRGFEAVSARPEPAPEAGGNLQAWARRQRYRIFRDLMRETGADAIVTAHHQDDQLETIIQKILRGAGLAAWQGMKVHDGDLFRPLLEVSKAELLRFASANHVPYRLDGSNEESTYARNFLRNGWFPVMDDLFPGWRDNLLRIPDRAREHEALAGSLIGFLQEGQPEQAIIRDRLLALPVDVQRTLLLQVLKRIDPAAGVSAAALETAGSLSALQTGRRLTLSGQWALLRDRELFRWVRHEGRQPEYPAETVVRQELERSPLRIGRVTLSIGEWEGKPDPEQLQLDADKLEWPLTVRLREEGDRFNPLGMQGSQSVAAHLTNEKIPAFHKDEVKVILSFDGTVCAVIFPELSPAGRPGTISERVRCDEGTRGIVRIRMNG